MPANQLRVSDRLTLGPRLTAIALVVVFTATAVALSGTPVEAKDWTPQIKVTRRAQIYWESLMRAADHDVRSHKKAAKQARRTLRRIEARLERAVERRARAKRELAEVRAELREASTALAAATVAPPPPPDPLVAALSLVIPEEAADPWAVTALTVPPAPSVPGLLVEDLPDTPGEVPLVSEEDVRQLKKQEKQQKRSFHKAKRQARRITRNTAAMRTRLNAAKSGKQNAIGRREATERSLGAWILAMEKYARIRATKKSKNRPGVTSPFTWPVRGHVSQYYGSRHDGLDIVAYRGAPVRAAAFGVVTYIGWNPWDRHGRAFMVVITHATRYETLYGHILPRRSVRVGQEVKKGEVIGYMGNTGFSTGTHLHFELRQGRTTIDPLGHM